MKTNLYVDETEARSLRWALKHVLRQYEDAFKTGQLSSEERELYLAAERMEISTDHLVWNTNWTGGAVVRLRVGPVVLR